jgi:MMP 1-O-methyltransferase
MRHPAFTEDLPVWWQAGAGVNGVEREELQVIQALADRTEGWLSDSQGLALYQLARLPGLGQVLEIGSFCGKSTMFLALGCKWSGSLVHSVDPHMPISQGGKEQYGQDFKPRPEGTLSAFLRTLETSKLGSFVEVHVATSVEVYRQFRGERFKLVFIDGSHDFCDVLLDYQMWSDRVSPGGYLVFHDSNFEGVARVLADHLDLRRFRADGVVGDGGWAMTVWYRMNQDEPAETPGEI